MTAVTTTDRPDIEDYRHEARAWLADNLEPRLEVVQHHDVNYYTPDIMAKNRALQRVLFEGGYAGITIPEAYGGRGLPLVYEETFQEEAAGFILPDFGVLSGTTYHVCLPTMVAHASDTLLRSLVPRVLAGEILLCQFFSEPTAGSDLAAARTTAVRDGDQWVINGQKIWSTYAHLADYGMCLARTDWEAPKHKGLTWFVIPCDAPGVTIRPIRQINDTSEFCEDFFDDVSIPDLNRVGDVNQGWTVTQTMLVYERGAGRPMARQSVVGPGPLAPDLVELARTAGSLQDSAIRQKIARGHTYDFVGRVLAQRIGELARLGLLNPGTAAYGKLFAGTYNPLRARLAVDIGGPGAMSWDPEDADGPGVSLRYLNGRIQSIAGGSNEMQRNGISERALGLPREPSFDSNKPFSQVLRDAAGWTGKV